MMSLAPTLRASARSANLVRSTSLSIHNVDQTRIAPSPCLALAVTASSFIPNRSLFSQAYLGGDKFNDRRDAFLKSTPTSDLASARSRALELALAPSPGPVLLSDDVTKLLYTVSSVQDLEEAAKALRAFISRSGAARAKNASVQRMNRMLTKDLLLLCRALAEQGGTQVADSLMQDKEFVAQLNLYGCTFDAEDGTDGGGGSMATFAPKILTIYAQILYDCNRFQDLFTFFDDCLEKLQASGQSSPMTPLDLLTLNVAACYKTAAANEEGRADAFDLATRYMGKTFEDTHAYFAGRAGCIYALLAIQCGEEAVAHEELAFVKSSLMRTNIQIYLYTKLGRLSDAIKTIEDAVRPADVPAFRRQKPKFSVEVVKALTSAVEVCEDGDIKKRLAILFHRLDDLAEISQSTLENIVLSPIGLQRVDNRTRHQKQQHQPDQQRQRQRSDPKKQQGQPKEMSQAPNNQGQQRSVQE